MSKDLTNVVELPTLYQQFIHKSRYARYLPELNRRESWSETVSRYTVFFEDKLHTEFNMSHDDLRVFNEIEEAILSLKVMPSMRALMSAGEALKRENVAGYNCSFMNIDDPRAFDEMMYILMNGTGVGFSVERQHISKLPRVPDRFDDTGLTIVVGDSKQGWAEAYRELIEALYKGYVPTWDTSQVRPAGTPLKTFGGRASGPKPLEDLFEFTVNTFRKASGSHLTSIQCHDLACKIGDIVVVGGVRRSALISLSNLSDQRMRDAKSGNWWISTAYRALANNSVAYTEKPEVGQYMDEWNSIYKSFSGERGIFNRQAARLQCEKYGRTIIGADGHPIDFGTNPCAEIILRSMQFCNLTEVVGRQDDTVESLRKKVRIAAILGTFQSTLSNFQYLREEWRTNTEEERLLGVSFTGIMDCPLLNGTLGRKQRNELLNELRELATSTNKIWAAKLGINPSAAITCVKPSGTVSQLVDASSGIHTRHSEHYIRTARNDLKDPLTAFMQSIGIPNEPCRDKPDSIVVFSFPISAPEGTMLRDERTAIDELENWLDFKEHWCHHSASVTVSVREHEWPEVGGWVYNQFDKISGVSFLPHDGGIYKQAPYQETTLDKLTEFSKTMPTEADWTTFQEDRDSTTSSQSLACVAGVCEI